MNLFFAQILLLAAALNVALAEMNAPKVRGRNLKGTKTPGATKSPKSTKAPKCDLSSVADTSNCASFISDCENDVNSLMYYCDPNYGGCCACAVGESCVVPGRSF